VCSNPWPNSNVSDGDAIAYDISSSVFSQLAIQSAVKTMRFVDVAVDRILELLGSIAWKANDHSHFCTRHLDSRVK
jgi:hypothetical protein